MYFFFKFSIPVYIFNRVVFYQRVLHFVEIKIVKMLVQKCSKSTFKFKIRAEVRDNKSIFTSTNIWPIKLWSIGHVTDTGRNSKSNGSDIFTDQLEVLACCFDTAVEMVQHFLSLRRNSVGHCCSRRQSVFYSSSSLGLGMSWVYSTICPR